MFSKVMASCIDWSIMRELAGQLTIKRKYAMTCITSIKIHMAFKETARHIVIPNWLKKAAFVVTYTEFPVTTAIE